MSRCGRVVRREEAVELTEEREERSQGKKVMEVEGEMAWTEEMVLAAAAALRPVKSR